MTGSQDRDWLRDWRSLPLNTSELAVLTVEIEAGDDDDMRADLIEQHLGWTRAYYEDNVRALAADHRLAELSPGMVNVLIARHPGEWSGRTWEAPDAFTRNDHV